MAVIWIKLKLLQSKVLCKQIFVRIIKESVSELWLLNFECFFFFDGFGYKNVTIFITENEERYEHGIGVFICKFIKK